MFPIRIVVNAKVSIKGGLSQIVQTVKYTETGMLDLVVLKVNQY